MAKREKGARRVVECWAPIKADGTFDIQDRYLKKGKPQLEHGAWTDSEVVDYVRVTITEVKPKRAKPKRRGKR